MNELQIFTYEGSEVRTVTIDNTVWWVLKDVCDILGLSNPSAVADRLDDDERAKFNLGRSATTGGGGETNIINESGLYNVILRSDKPEAKNFKRWVTHEVLPSIRKTGAYMTPDTLEAAILNPDTMIRLLTELKNEQDSRRRLEVENTRLVVDKQIMQPKAEYFDELVDRNTLTGIRETAKQLEIGQKAFVDFMIDKKYLYRDKKGKLQPYAGRSDGLFALKESFNDKTAWSGTQLMVTPKGRETFRLLCLPVR